MIRRIMGWVLALGLTVALAALSRGEWRATPSGDGALRLTLSARPERIETCRRLAEAELAARPAHMRQALECEGIFATYRLRVWRAGDLLDEQVLQGGGLRRDRPIHLLRQYRMPPGEQVIRLELRRVEMVAAPASAEPEAEAAEGLSLDRDIREAEERQRRRLEAIPAELTLEERISVAPRQVILLTWDPVTRRLDLRR
jgi:hypothetical protein